MAKTPTVIIWKKLSDCLKEEAQADKPLVGFMHGFSQADPLHIVGCSSLPDASPQNFKSVYQLASGALPAGLGISGIFFKANQTNVPAIIKQVCQKVLPSSLQELLGTERILVWAVAYEKDSTSSLYHYNPSSGDLHNVACQYSDVNILDTCILTRLTAALKLQVEFHHKKEVLQNRVLAEVQYLQDRVASYQTALHVQGTEHLVYSEPVVEQPMLTCAELLTQALQRDDQPDIAAKKRHRNKDFTKDVLHVKLLFQMCNGAALESFGGCSPIIHHEHGDFRQVEVPVPVDVMGYVHPDMGAEGLSGLLLPAVERQLSVDFQNLIKFQQGETFHRPHPFHFKPAGLGHAITLVYPDSVEEEQLESYRKTVHRALLLPGNKPLVRRRNAMLFPDEAMPGGYLVNTHLGLPPATGGGTQYTVQGTYTYHHYMQDRVDDNGWGCAYRSLQTLVSWFRFQGYTDKPIPTHQQIQQCLVDVGDKDAMFVGSKKWIGSTEVSYVLDQWLGVSCKILFVSSGAELGSKGRELAQHFQTQGTPIMIGGGVLAHTILGVDFNDVTGELKFLILDPHYTGGEQLELIQDKGWCGWKGADFWDQNAYYNMCMPQTPHMI